MTIRITGDIDNAAFRRFSLRLEECLDANMTIELASDGGSSYAAMAIADKMAGSDIHFTVIATGLVASAATLILAAGDRRIMTPNAWVMVHEDINGIDEGARVSTAEAAIKHARRLETQWNTLLAHYTKLTAAEWEAINKTGDTYLTPGQCLEYGLIDEVLK